MPQSIAELGKQFINDPVRVEVAPQATTAERVEQYSTFLNQAEKQALLTLKLRAGLADGSIDRALVFTRTKHGADRVVKHLTAAGIEAAAIHGNKSQGQRTAAIKGFRSGDVPVLVATDIAARGIDIPGVSHVFNFEMPNVPEQYVHRIGRTARAGADGISISFVAPDERPYLKDIERLTRVKLTPMPLPDDFTTEAKRLPLPSRKSMPVERPERAAGDRPQRGRRPERDGAPRGRRPERAERPERNERSSDWSPIVRPDEGRGEAPRHARGERTHDGARAERRDRPARNGSHHEQRGERADRPARAEHRGERAERPARAEHRGGERAQHGRPERRDEAPRQQQGRPQRPAHEGRGNARAEAYREALGDRPLRRAGAPQEHRDGYRGEGYRGEGHRNEGQRHDGHRNEGHRGPRGPQGSGRGPGHGAQGAGRSDQGGARPGGQGQRRFGGKPQGGRRPA